MDRIDRAEGRRLFGLDPERYDHGRPEYPAWVFDALEASGALRDGAMTLEIGPGSGLATGVLLERGARPLTLVEPDPRLAAWLRERLATAEATVVNASFEDAALPDQAFELVAAATAFHWIEPASGLAKVRRLLKAGGTAALIWNVFQDMDKADAFHEATKALLSPLASSPSGAPDTLPFALDRAAREREALAAGFTEVTYEETRWAYQIDADQVKALYGNFSSIQRLTPRAREALLDDLARIAREQFDGRVIRNMTTCLYQLR